MSRALGLSFFWFTFHLGYLTLRNNRQSDNFRTSEAKKDFKIHKNDVTKHRTGPLLGILITVLTVTVGSTMCLTVVEFHCLAVLPRFLYIKVL